jgi:hypothetical protein
VNKRNTLVLVHFLLLFPFHKRKSMIAVLHSDINSLMSGLLYLTGQPCCKKSRSAKVKDGIINLILRNYLVDRYTVNCSVLNLLHTSPLVQASHPSTKKLHGCGFH